MTITFDVISLAGVIDPMHVRMGFSRVSNSPAILFHPHPHRPALSTPQGDAIASQSTECILVAVCFICLVARALSKGGFLCCSPIPPGTHVYKVSASQGYSICRESLQPLFVAPT